MARKVRDDKLAARSVRMGLRQRREPYWKQMALGAHLGYRRLTTGGTWIARWRDPEAGQRRYEAIGPADDHVDADGRRVLSFDQAQAKAREFFSKMARQVAGDFQPTDGPYTVEMALADYFKAREQRRRQVSCNRSAQGGRIKYSDSRCNPCREADQNQNRQVVGRTCRDAGTGADRKGEGAKKFKPVNDPRARRATANRTLALLKAALNEAHKDGRVPHDDAWRKVRPFKAASAARVRILTDDEVVRFLNACAPDFRKLATAAFFTGARYSELARVVAKDCNADAETLHIRFSEGGRERHVILTGEAQAYFAKLLLGCPVAALVFTHDDGTPWKRSNQQGPMREACKAARIEALGFHQLRHTHASRSVMRRAPLAVVAAQLGHVSTAMVEKHYGHLQPNYVADTVREAFGALGIIEPDKMAGFHPKRSV